MEDTLDTAANPVEVETAESTEQTASPTETVTETQAFARRLKEATEKARADEREQIAHSYGYDSWAEYNKAQTDSKLLDKGLDPDTVRPVLKDLIKNDPDYIEGMKYREEKMKEEANIWAKEELNRLNKRFGLNIASVDDLDEATIKNWNNGMPLEKAYVSEHFDELRKKTIEATKTSIGSGKEHLTETQSSTPPSSQPSITDREMAMFRALNPYKSDDEIKAYINKSHK